MSMKTTNQSELRFIWLDSLVNTSTENHDTKRVLEKTIQTLITFEEVKQCISYLQSLQTEQAILIVSGRLGQEILPFIHDYSQIIAVYVYCSDKKRNELWSKKYFKVKCVIVTFKELLDRVQYHFQHSNEYQIDEILSLHFYRPNSSDKNDEFMFQQSIFHCLSHMKYSNFDKTSLISFCKSQYLNDKRQLYLIDQFYKTYSSEQAIHWWTRDCFLSDFVNKSIEKQDFDLLHRFHFILRDLCLQLRSNSCTTSMHTYRAQILSLNDINLFRNSIGNFVSIGKALLTNSNYEQTYAFLRNSSVKTDYHRVLFDIQIEPPNSSDKPLSNISHFHCYSSQDLILFMFGSIFHLVGIDEDDDVITIRLENSSKYTQNILKDFEEIETNVLKLATIFFQRKMFDLAERLYLELVSKTSDDYQSLIYSYQQLIKIQSERTNDYERSLHYSKKILEIHQMILRDEDPELANDYHLIGDIYSKKRMFMNAFDAYNRALHIWTRSLGDEHPKVANCCYDIANLCEHEKRYSDAVDYYQKALFIREKILLPYHLDLAKTRQKIGNVYIFLRDYKQAIKYYHSTLNILTKSKSTKNFEIIKLMKQISQAYEADGDLRQARIQLEKIVDQYQQGLPADHPEMLEIFDEINRLSTNSN